MIGPRNSTMPRFTRAKGDYLYTEAGCVSTLSDRCRAQSTSGLAHGASSCAALPPTLRYECVFDRFAGTDEAQLLPAR
jgi:hypothetical protein